MKFLFFISTFLIGFSFSCKKKTVAPKGCISSCDQTNESFSNDTVYPSDYLMTYPGSWWQYHNGAFDTCTNWESVIYQSIETINNCSITAIDHHILPHSTRYGHLANNITVSNPAGSNTQFHKIIDEGQAGDTIGTMVSYYVSPTNPPGTYFKWVRVNEGEINNVVVQGQSYNEVMVTRKDFYIIQPNSSGLQSTIKYYYAKNVGLIKTFVLQNGNQVGNQELVSYYIAPH